MQDFNDLHDDDDVVTASPATPPVAGTDTPPAAPDAAPAAPSPTPTAPEVDNAIESFLWDFGIEGGKIQFQDGEVKHFNDLSEVEKLNVLKDLVQDKATKEAQRYDLTDEEVAILNLARENKVSVQAVIDEIAINKAKEYLSQPSDILDFNELPADEVYARFLVENNPDASDEDLRAELELAKQGKFYEQTVNGLRKDFATKQDQYIAAYKAEQQQAELQELEAQRAELVQGVVDIDNVSGFAVDNNIKNSILSKLVEVNDNNDSLFLEEVFSNPKNLFKAAWLYYEGENAFDAMERQYKTELQNAYRRGKNEALNGLPTTPNVVGTTAPTTNSQGANVKRQPKSIDDLHGDD